jgi:carbonic anhydrase/acetyltransferase-like protein (isoleucine patch superfamily)
MTVAERLARHLDRIPDLTGALYVAESAVIEGDVVLARDSSVWHGAVLRGDINEIRLGECSNIQDLACVHLADGFGCYLGNRVTVGHCAVVHACTVEDDCLIGIKAVVLDGAVIGAGSIVGAGALVTKGTVIPPGSLVVGAPARVLRPVTDAEREGNTRLALKYVEVARGHAARRRAAR